MTSRREAESRRLRQELLNAVSHELNTPLTPVLIHLRHLAERTGDLDQDLRRSFSVVNRNLERLIERVGDIIKVAQLDSQRYPVRMRNVALSELVEEVVQDYRAPARAAGLRLEYHPDTDARVHADPHRFKEVMSNLLDNAIRFTPEGKVTVQTDDNTIYAFVHVRDSGVGFRPEDRERLFEPFSHLDADIPGAFHGAGLGLFISKNIMDLHGGQIEAFSDGPGHGSTFTVKVHMVRGTMLPFPVEDPSAREVAFNRRIEDLV